MPAVHTEVLLETTDLTRRYGPVTALDALNLTVRAGECVAMMGPNGSGKTTAAELISGVLEPTAGRAEICGHSIHEEPAAVSARRDLAYVPDTARLYDDLTIIDHLRLVAAAHGVADRDLSTRSEGLLERLDLADRATFFPRQLSRGMRQKTAIACALIRPFRVLVLDEPIVGLDSASVEVFREVLLNCRKARRAVLLMTHAETFASAVATRMLRIEEGRLIGS
jgi:ABC-2 type transport system ATP-binding protein